MTVFDNNSGSILFDEPEADESRLDGGAWQAARAGRQLRISASQKPLERDTQRRGPVLRKALPSQDAFELPHLSQEPLDDRKKNV